MIDTENSQLGRNFMNTVRSQSGLYTIYGNFNEHSLSHYGNVTVVNTNTTIKDRGILFKMPREKNT